MNKQRIMRIRGKCTACRSYGCLLAWQP